MWDINSLFEICFDLSKLGMMGGEEEGFRELYTSQTVQDHTSSTLLHVNAVYCPLHIANGRCHITYIFIIAKACCVAYNVENTSFLLLPSKGHQKGTVNAEKYDTTKIL